MQTASDLMLASERPGAALNRALRAHSAAERTHSRTHALRSCFGGRILKKGRLGRFFKNARTTPQKERILERIRSGIVS